MPLVANTNQQFRTLPTPCTKEHKVFSALKPFSPPREGVQGCWNYKKMGVTTLQRFIRTHFTPCLEDCGVRNFRVYFGFQ